MEYKKYFPTVLEIITSSKFAKTKKAWAKKLMEQADEINDQKTAEKIVLATWRNEVVTSGYDFTKCLIIQDRKDKGGSDRYRSNPFYVKD